MNETIQNLRSGLWAIEQRGVRSFLFAGPDRALLVDTGFGGDLPAVCRTLTDAPITLLTTHADPDHIGGDGSFPVQYLHPAEFEQYRNRAGHPPKALPLWEGDVFTAGEYALEVVLIPGHTPGSIALLDRRHRFILCGDSVQTGCIYMHGAGRSLPALLCSLQKLDRMRREGLFDTVYASHGEAALPAEILTAHLALTDALLRGDAVPLGPAPERFPDTVKTYGHGPVTMYYYG